MEKIKTIDGYDIWGEKKDNVLLRILGLVIIGGFVLGFVSAILK